MGSGSSNSEIIPYVLIVGLALMIYFVPTYVAFKRKHGFKGIIFVINLTFGWTLIGWAGTLIWAIFPSEKSLIDPLVGNVTGTGVKNAGDSLGEAGLGMSRGYNSEKDKTKQLKEAAELFKNGDLSQKEYSALKRKIIEG